MIQHHKRHQAASLPNLFQSMHADRKRVFVDMLKWDVPHDGLLERDQYDTDLADYLILQDSETGEHKASVRVLPTVGGHMFSDVFPFLCEGDVPRGPRIREISRFVIAPRVPRRERQLVRNMLIRALIDFGQMTGVEAYTCVCDIAFLTQLLAGGWRIEPLGLPQNYQGSMIGALMFHVEHDSIARTSEAWRAPGPMLRLVERDRSMAA
jgi:N-acyl-L-homoserine lactone synthetase